MAAGWGGRCVRYVWVLTPRAETSRGHQAWAHSPSFWADRISAARLQALEERGRKWLARHVLC